MQIRSMELGSLTGHDAGRQLLETMYRELTGTPVPEIRVTDRGKPYFATGGWHFSISHTKRRVFCAISQAPIGIDAEELDRRIDLRLGEKILSETEKQRYAQWENKREALLRFWVLKEATAKFTGQGLGKAYWNTDFSPNDPRIFVMDNCYLAIVTE